MKVGNLKVLNVIRNLPLQLIPKSVKEMPMRIANTFVTNAKESKGSNNLELHKQTYHDQRSVWKS